MTAKTDILSFSEQITNEDHKQNLNLTFYAWNVIENDTIAFSPDVNSPINLTRFLNKIIVNCEETPSLLPFPCNISSIANKKQRDFSLLLSSSVSGSETSLKENLLNKLMSKYNTDTKQIVKKRKAKGKARKFRLSNATYDLICSVPKDDYKTLIFEKPGDYLKVLFEEYCLLPSSERERIFFADIITKLNRAISQNQEILISTKDQKFDVIPYKLTTDTYLSHLYLAGKSSTHPATEKYVFSSFRISRIEHIEFLGHSEHSLDKQEQEQLENRISKQNIQFLLPDSVTVKLRFTKEGLQKYQTQSYLRPSFANKISDFIYEFQITPFQASAYFFKFGKDVEILEPESLRNYFINEYTAALHAYSQM